MKLAAKFSYNKSLQVPFPSITVASHVHGRSIDPWSNFAFRALDNVLFDCRESDRQECDEETLPVRRIFADQIESAVVW